jgi:hypothetical protein
MPDSHQRRLAAKKAMRAHFEARKAEKAADRGKPIKR